MTEIHILFGTTYIAEKKKCAFDHPSGSIGSVLGVIQEASYAKPVPLHDMAGLT